MRKISLLVLTMIFVVSCRDPIDLGFEATDSRVIIDGYITDAFHPHSVFLSYSSGFQDGIYVPLRIRNATVNLEDDQGN